MNQSLKLLDEVRACQLCAPYLPHPPRPVFRLQSSAKILIVGQAPGNKVHQTGIPWNDPSGQRLRTWLHIPPELFYDESQIAIIPIGLCFPGVNHKGGDLPPRKECAPTWHPRLLDLLPNLSLRILVGSYAQTYYLGTRRQTTLTETVAAFQSYLPLDFPLPHPSWRNTAWLKKNPWFEQNVVPALRQRVHSELRR